MLTIIIVVAVLVVLGAIAAGITAFLLRGWAKGVLAGGGFTVDRLDAEQIDALLGERRAFVVTARREFPYPPHKIFDALQLNGTFSWIPLVNGIRYRDDYRREGALRTFDGTLFACEEKIVTMAPNRRLTATGTNLSIPFAVTAFAEDYQLTETEGGTVLAWTIAVRPRFGGFLPLRWAAPFIRPFLTLGIRGLTTRV